MPSGPTPAPPPFATATRAGLVSATTQTFGGDKTFTGKINVDSILRLAIYPTVSLPVATGNEGGIVYDTTTNQVKFSDGTSWLASVGSFGIQEEGVALTGRPALNFIGAGFTAVDNIINSRTDLTLHQASASQEGVVSTGTQSFAGNKTFTGITTISGAAGNTLVVDTDTLVVDATNNRVGIGTSTPTQQVEVRRDQDADTFLRVTNANADNVGNTLAHAQIDVFDGTYSTRLTSWPRAHISGATLLADTGGLFSEKPNGMAFEVATGDIKFVKKSGGVQSLLGRAIYSTGNFEWDGTTFNIDATNNRVGIGSATPSEALQVVGNVRFSGALMPNNLAGTAGQVLTSGGAGVSPTWAAAGGSISIGAAVTSGTTGSLLFVGAGPVLAQDNPNLFWDDTNNRLGIGTATPAHRLDVLVNVAAPAVRITNNDTSGSFAGQNVRLDCPTGSGAPSIAFYKNNVFLGTIGGYETAAFGYRDGMNIEVPTGKNFNIRQGSTSIAYFEATTGNFLVDTNTLYVDAVNNRLGINTTPSFPFHASAATNAKAYLAAGFSSANPSLTVDNPSGKVINTTSGTVGAGHVYDDTGSWSIVSDAAATIRAGTTGNSGTVRMGIDTSFRYFVGPSFASALFSVNTSGNTNQTGSNTSVGFNSGANIALTGDFDILPSADNTGDIGTDALRWRRIRAVSVVTGASLVFDNHIRPNVTDYVVEVRKADNVTVVASFDTINNRVGIGTNTPAQALDVVGNITTTGTISAAEITVSSNVLNIGTMKIASGTAAPVSGAWNRGDRVYNTLPSPGGNGGWICTTSGTPGTWKEFELVSE